MLVLNTQLSCIGQRDGFAKEIFELIQCKGFEQLGQYVVPTSHMIQIMHWEEDSSSLPMIKQIQEAVEVDFTANANEMLDRLKAKNLDFQAAEIEGVTYQKELLAFLTIIFSCGASIDSFSIGVIEMDQMYLVGSFYHGPPPVELLARKQFLDTPQPDHRKETLFLNYEKLTQKLNDHANESHPWVLALSDSLITIFEKYQGLIELMDSHISYFETRIYSGDPMTGVKIPKTEMEINYRYWFGNNREMENGHAHYLKGQLEEFTKRISLVNQGLSETGGEEDVFLPTSITDMSSVPNSYTPVKSWEDYYFEGPVVANIAVLESLKYAVTEVMEKEVVYLSELYAKRQP